MNVDKSKESYLVQLMLRGFNRAAVSFSKLINTNIEISRNSFFLIRNDRNFSCISEETCEIAVLTTKIVGELSGMSYFILNEHERNELLTTANIRGEANHKLAEGFLLEIDNIISASVIAEIANALNLKIYGDVPLINYITPKEVSSFVESDSIGDSSGIASVVLSNITFQIGKKENFSPQFIWKINHSIFDVIPQQ